MGEQFIPTHYADSTRAVKTEMHKLKDVKRLKYIF